MYPEVVSKLRCAACQADLLHLETYATAADGDVREGVVWCEVCRTWYPIEDGLLDMLLGGLAYVEDRARFWQTHQTKLSGLGLKPDEAPVNTAEYALQRTQQQHFDSYTGDGQLDYSLDMKKPFWAAADKLSIAPWREQIQPGTWLLDVGSANGRSTFQMADQDINILGFDVSKQMIRQAIEQARQGRYRARISFFAADATQFPLKATMFDYVLIYGVLHHLPKPSETCREVARVLKSGGFYFGHENNQTLFRPFFEFLQKVYPIWHEEAGPEALISPSRLHDWFSNTGVQLEIKTSVFVPPHLVNLTTFAMGYRLLQSTDKLAQAIPILKDNGGVILIQGTKS